MPVCGAILLNKYSNIIPDCDYWEFGNGFIKCKITGQLCNHEECNLDLIDPTGIFREEINEKRKSLCDFIRR